LGVTTYYIKYINSTWNIAFLISLNKLHFY
jgi:hypothetical protein